MPAPWPQTRDELLEANCWFSVDAIPRQPEVTGFKRQARRQQAWWREARGIPIGAHLSGRPPVARPNGSRADLDHARQTGCNFMSEPILNAVKDRLAHPEPHQTLNEDRLWADLLSSMPMCFNLFGELVGDAERLGSAAAVLWPGHPGTASEVRFEWSPGRHDPLYLNNRSAFDAAVLVDLDGGRRAALGIETKYHEDIKRERPPDKNKRLPRYCEVTERSEAFADGWEKALIGTDLQQLWLDHLLALSMLQHPTAGWAEARFAVVYPANNPSVQSAVDRYRAVLKDDSTFAAWTIEDLLDAQVLHTTATATAFRERYLW